MRNALLWRVAASDRKEVVLRKLLKWTARLVIFGTLAAMLAGVVMRDEIHRLVAVNTLFEPKNIVRNFSEMDRAFLSAPMPRGDIPVTELPEGPAYDLPPKVEQWIVERAVTSLLILQNGRIRHESYHLGTEPEDLRIGWSISKAYVSALIGILLDEGVIGSLEDQVTQYVPNLEDTAYDGARLVDVLQMTSGVAFDEDYLDYDSDINRMGRELALGGSMDGFTTSLTERRADPGTDWQYVSIDTHVLAMIIRKATGRNLADLLSEKVVARMGLEKEPYFLADGDGVAFALGGLNKTTRDFARFGLLYEQMGQLDGKQIVPADWVAASTAASAPTEPGELGFGYQWWLPKGASDGEFFARGIYGQYVYIDRSRDVVIVATGADRAFREPGVDDTNIGIFRFIASAL